MPILRKMRTGITLLTSWVVYLFSHFIPRTDRIKVYIGWHKNEQREVLADNAKYAFLHAHAQKNTLDKVIWIGQDKLISQMLKKQGYESYPYNSFWGIYYALRAGYTVIDAYFLIKNWRFTGRSKVVQLWHGIQIKKTGYESSYSLEGRSRIHRFMHPNLYTTYHFISSTSPYSSGLMSSLFQVTPDKIKVTGYPRNDALFGDIPGKEIDANPQLMRRVKIAEKWILYAPTFRTTGTATIPFDLIDLDRELGKMGYRLFLQLHPKFANKSFDANKFNNIEFLTAGYDTHATFDKFDILITDYSSLYIDFLLLDRPIIFYVYDIETYKNTMGLQDNFDQITAGPKVTSYPELIEELKLLHSGKDTYKTHRKEMVNLYFLHRDGKSAERTLNAMK